MAEEREVSKGTHAALKLKHMSSGKKTNMPVVVVSYTQTATPSFTSTAVYGRPDPIVTYQNTKRSFQCTMHTCPYEEREKIPAADIPNINGRLAGDSGAWNSSIAGALAAIYQMMYPALEYSTVGGMGVFLLKGPPLLEIEIPGALNPSQGAGGGGSSLIFVPETFQVIKLADTNKINIVMRGPEDLKFLVPTDGYSFTLGGTILHRNYPPGFEVLPLGQGVEFTHDNFPFGIAPSFED